MLKSLKKPLLRAAALAALAVAPAALAGWFHPRPPTWAPDGPEPGEVSIGEILDWPPGRLLWVDARGRGEYERGHIPGAVLLNEDEWEALFFDFLKSEPFGRAIVVYCGARECRESHYVAERLRADLGEGMEIFVLHGGWEAWEAGVESR